MSHPHNFATYIPCDVTIVYAFIGNYSRSILYCIKPGIFSRSALGGFSSCASLALALPQPLASAKLHGAAVAAQGLPQFASPPWCSRFVAALPG
ncbi:hypothetical protein CSB93_3836 [Pseudomonas paraeruginosa]|uniref:Uncharacterized protein n=1 Tax=Pseudomonas paraeruginosa TaxID=2994495 RepID=A0A2R3IP48_9PSED|nr:hypothetical protein CSB93_3836 [Pseudomonas paraeruginosa]AWE94422.1 hypothetical protein CSC28_2619 [Pseudomonas paraeruginosa]